MATRFNTFFAVCCFPPNRNAMLKANALTSTLRRLSLNTPALMSAQAPKRPPSAFLSFSKEVRAQNANAHLKDVAKMAAQRWAAMPEDAKAPYVRTYEAEKERFEEAKARFERDHPVDAEALKTQQREKRLKKALKKAKAEKAALNMPKRPAPPYLLFANQFTKVKGLSGSIEASARWKAMTDAEKAEYTRTHERAKDAYELNLAAWMKKDGNKDALEEINAKIAKCKAKLKDL